MKKLAIIVIALIILIVGGSLLYIKLKPQSNQKTQTSTQINDGTINKNSSPAQGIVSGKSLLIKGNYDYDKKLLSINQTYLIDRPYSRSPNNLVSDNPKDFSGNNFVKLGITDKGGNDIGDYYLDLNKYRNINFTLFFPYKEEFSSQKFNFFVRDQDNALLTTKNIMCDFKTICQVLSIK